MSFLEAKKKKMSQAAIFERDTVPMGFNVKCTVEVKQGIGGQTRQIP